MRKAAATACSGWRSATLARRYYGMRARQAAAYGVILGVDLDSSFGSTEGHIWKRVESHMLQITAEEQRSERGFRDLHTGGGIWGGGVGGNIRTTGYILTEVMFSE